VKCSLCVDGVLGIVGSEPVFCGNCDGEGVVYTLPVGKPYVEDVGDSRRRSSESDRVPGVSVRSVR